MRYLDSDRLKKIISLSPLRGSLNVEVLASTAEDDVKCIFASFSKYLHFGVFMVTFLGSFLVSFYDHFSAKHQKWSKNEGKKWAENHSKMATVNNPNKAWVKPSWIGNEKYCCVVTSHPIVQFQILYQLNPVPISLSCVKTLPCLLVDLVSLSSLFVMTL